MSEKGRPSRAHSAVRVSKAARLPAPVRASFSSDWASCWARSSSAFSDSMTPRSRSVMAAANSHSSLITLALATLSGSRGQGKPSPLFKVLMALPPSSTMAPTAYSATGHDGRRSAMTVPISRITVDAITSACTMCSVQCGCAMAAHSA